MTEIKLYKKDSKGKIRTWRGQVEGDEVVTRTGLEGGKKKEERRRATPKNTGKTNATNAEQQACVELLAKASKEKDKGYFETIEEALSEVVVLPMLAHPYKDKKHNIQWPAYVQPKLDGVRCMVKLDPQNEEITMLSRKGKPFPEMPKLLEELAAICTTLKHVVYLDGELFSDEIPFEEISGICRRFNHEAKGASHLLDLIKFNVFDCVDILKMDEPFRLRKARLSAAVGSDRFEMIKLVPTVLCTDEASMLKMHEQFVAEGHEGTIIRNGNGVYLLNGRSNDLLKHKDFTDNEFEIIGFRSGEGRDEGTVIWECKTSCGGTFSVRPRGTWKQRADWFANGDTYVGKMLTVRYQELTSEGIPRFPVGITFRDYE